LEETRAGGMAQVVESLPSKPKADAQNHKKKKKRKEKRKRKNGRN
jgi:hypothetical protein